MNEEQAIAWARTAQKGQRCTYFIGHLAHDRLHCEAGDVADIFLGWQRFGGVALTQRRMGPNEWEYIAERTGMRADDFLNLRITRVPV